MLDILFFTSLGFYFLSMALNIISLAARKKTLSRIIWIVFLAGFTVHLAYFAARGIVAGRLPMSNQFEFAMSFALGIALTYIFLRIKFRADWITTIALVSTFLMTGYAATLPRAIKDLMPALRSIWFTLHIFPAVFSYASFFLSGCAGLIYLVRMKKGEAESEPKMRHIDHLSYRLVSFGLLFLTVVILTGMVWAEEAWSSFWSWDPKELWSFITWIVYAIYLHQRLHKKWQGKRMAIFSIIGVAIVLFTFVGVNTLLPGLHSYR